MCVHVSSTVIFTPSHSWLYDIHESSTDCSDVNTYYIPAWRKSVHVYLLHSYKYLPVQWFDGITIRLINDE